MKLLLTGDIHLGRSSSGLSGIEGVDGSAAGAWLRIVDMAIAEGVAAVLVSGDLVDAQNRYFEATAPLQRGIARLSDAGIEVFAVAGNHDHNVTPALLRFHGQQGHKVSILGAGGIWQARDIVRGNDAVRIVGWSFPTEHVGHDPTALFPDDELSGGGIPVIGMVHGDLDVPDSRYAGLSSARLESLGVQGWLLGHIHSQRMRASDGCPWILYPGSPQALDAGEPGQHGAWLVETVSGALQQPRFVPLSTVHYAAAEVSLSGAASADEVRTQIQSGIQRTVERFALPDSVGAVVLDVELVGESLLVDEVVKAGRELADETLIAPGVEVKVRTVANRVAPPLPLDELAKGRGIVAALARAIVGIERGDVTSAGDSAALMHAVEEAVRRRPLEGMVMDGDREVQMPLTDQEIRSSAAAAARRLLAAIVRRGGPGSPEVRGDLA